MACRVSTKGITFQDATGAVVGSIASSSIRLKEAFFDALRCGQAEINTLLVDVMKISNLEVTFLKSQKIACNQVDCGAVVCTSAVQTPTLILPVTSIVCNAVGIWSEKKQIKLEIQRIAPNVACLKVPSVLDVSSVAGKITMEDTTGNVFKLPTSFFPIFEVQQPVIIQDDEVQAFGVFKITTDGKIEINNAFGNFSGEKKMSGLPCQSCLFYLVNS